MAPPVAIVPVKSLDGAKSRLAGALEPEARRALVLGMLAGVVDAACGAGLAVCVVSPDPAVHAAARALGAEALDDGGRDLTGAVAHALAHHADAEAVVVLPGDLPDVTADDVRALLDAARPLAVAPAPDGTTHGVAARPPAAFTPSYGPGSAARHGGVAVYPPGLRRDVDTPADLPAGRGASACA